MRARRKLTGWGPSKASRTVDIYWGNGLNVQQELLGLLDEVLSLRGRGALMTSDSKLLGAVPELDSMAVVAVLSAMEERFGITIDDDEIEGSAFATVGSLVDFVASKLPNA